MKNPSVYVYGHSNLLQLTVLMCFLQTEQQIQKKKAYLNLMIWLVVYINQNYAFTGGMIE